jgi:hypothetical protein
MNCLQNCFFHQDVFAFSGKARDSVKGIVFLQPWTPADAGLACHPWRSSCKKTKSNACFHGYSVFSFTGPAITPPANHSCQAQSLAVFPSLLPVKLEQNQLVGIS